MDTGHKTHDGDPDGYRKQDIRKKAGNNIFRPFPKRMGQCNLTSIF